MSVGPNPATGFLIKRENWDIQKEVQVRTWVEDNHVQAKDRGLREANLLTPQSQTFSLGTVRNKRLLFKPSSLCHSVTAGLEMNAAPNFTAEGGR